MVTVRDAAQSALTFANELLGDSRINSLLLEEIELSDDEHNWLVTVSVPSPRVPNTGLGMLAASNEPQPEPRDYKVIRVDAETGTPKDIKIRKF